MLKFPITDFILRGVLGGVVGWLLLFIFMAYRYPWFAFVVLYAPLYGGVVGSVVGFVMWVCFNMADRRLGIVVRAFIGAGLLASVVGLFFLRGSVKKSDPAYENPGVAARGSKGATVADIALILLLGGAIPGATARPKSGRRREADED